MAVSERSVQAFERPGDAGPLCHASRRQRFLRRETGFRVEMLGLLDRHRNLTAMAESIMRRDPLTALRPLIRGSRRFLGDLVVRLPRRENLLAIAVRA